MSIGAFLAVALTATSMSYDCTVDSVFIGGATQPLSQHQEALYGIPLKLAVTPTDTKGDNQITIVWRGAAMKVARSNPVFWSNEGQSWKTLYTNCEDGHPICVQLVFFAPHWDGQARLSILANVVSADQPREMYKGLCKPDGTPQ